MKSISTINRAITENIDCLIVKVCLIYQFKNVGVSLNHGVSLCFVSLLAFRTCWAAFQVKNNVRKAPASSAFTLFSKP